MKKLLALVLAVAMVLSLASVAFAAKKPLPEKRYAVYVNGSTLDDGTMGFIEQGYVPNAGDSVYYKIELKDKNDNHGIDFGSYDVKAKYLGASFSDYKKEFKLTADWEIGEEFIESVNLVPVNYKRAHTTNESKISRTKFFIEVATKDAVLLEEQDVVGTIKIKAKKAFGKLDDSINPLHDNYDSKEVTLDVAFTLVPSLNDSLSNEENITDSSVVYSFGEGEEEQVFNLYGNMGRFEVNTKGQGDLVISADVDYNKGIEAIDADHAYVYYNGNGAAFNKIGTLYLTADYGDHLYKVMADGTLKELEGNYDTDEDAFKLRTRTLGSFVIAEEELNLESVNAAVLAK